MFVLMLLLLQPMYVRHRVPIITVGRTVRLELVRRGIITDLLSVHPTWLPRTTCAMVIMARCEPSRAAPRRAASQLQWAGLCACIGCGRRGACSAAPPGQPSQLTLSPCRRLL